MNIFKLILFLAISWNTIYGQKIYDTIYYDAQWKETSIDNSMYYRILSPAPNNLIKCEDFWNTGEIQMSGYFSSIEDESREGTFIWYYKNGKINKKIEYKKNEANGLIQEFGEDGELLLEYVNDHRILDNASEMDTMFLDLKDHIENNMIYPLIARETGIQGIVFINFFIDKSGQIFNAKILRGVHKSIDEEALRVLNLYDKWLIPKYKGKETSVRIGIPTHFVLVNEK